MQFLYLILSIYYGRKNPLYFLIFPIALVSGRGAFIDPRTVLFWDDFFIVGKNIYKDVIILYLFIVVFVLSKQCKYYLLRKTPMKWYGTYILVLMLITFINAGTSNEAVNVMRLFTHMVLGYFLLLLIFSTANPRQFVSFFNMLLTATGIYSIFYILNSAKILPLYYQETLYQEIGSGEGSFYRDFNTIPYFSHFLFILAFTFTIFKSKIFNRKAILFILIIYPFVLLYTFTRSLLVVVIIECITVILILIIKNPKLFFRSSTLKLAIAGVALVCIGLLMFNNELSYFSRRIESAKSKGTKESNVLIRVAYHATAYQILRSNNTLLFGDGLNKKDEPKMSVIGAWTVDSTIPFLIIYTGIVGVLFYYFIGFHFLFRTISHLKKWFNPFSLTLLAIIMSTLFSSLMMGGYRWGDPFIFINYVLVMVVETLNLKGNIFQ